MQQGFQGLSLCAGLRVGKQSQRPRSEARPPSAQHSLPARHLPLHMGILSETVLTVPPAVSGAWRSPCLIGRVDGMGSNQGPLRGADPAPPMGLRPRCSLPCVWATTEDEGPCRGMSRSQRRDQGVAGASGPSSPYCGTSRTLRAALSKEGCYLKCPVIAASTFLLFEIQSQPHVFPRAWG